MISGTFASSQASASPHDPTVVMASISIYLTSGFWRLKSDELPDATVFVPKPHNADDMADWLRAA